MKLFDRKAKANLKLMRMAWADATVQTSTTADRRRTKRVPRDARPASHINFHAELHNKREISVGGFNFRLHHLDGRCVVYSGDVRRRALAEVASGASAREAARRVGVSRNAVREWCAAAGVALAAGRRGGAVPEPEPAGPRTSPRSRLTLAHRVLIAAGLRRGDGPRAIGRELGFVIPSI